MPKKFQGENTKAVVAKARKGAAREAAEQVKTKAEEEAFWADEDKNVQRKLQRKEEKVKKKMETVERKALNRVMHDDEINAIAAREKVVPTTSKLTRAQIVTSLEQQTSTAKSSTSKKSEEEPLQENVNRLVMDGLNARGMDEAIAALSVKSVELDRHPERRVKAAYDAFEQTHLPHLKAENPNMRLSQLKQLLKKDWMKSPDNPLNQRHAAYNDSIRIAPGAVICDECQLIGDITIGCKTVIHPKARIVAEAGPIVIGENNLIEEQVQIINRVVDGKTTSGSSAPAMLIGNNNVFEVDSHCEALRIGDNNILEAKSHVSRDVELTNGCVIGAMCRITSHEIVPENTVIFGQKYDRRIQAERPTAQTLQLEFLTRVLPNYHHLVKTRIINK